MTESTDFIESNWKQWTGTADTNSRTTEIFSDQYGNHFQWTHIHEADYNNYDDVDDSRDFWILGDGQGHQRQFDSPITAKQALQKINAGRAQEVFADEALLEDDTTSCLFLRSFWTLHFTQYPYALTHNLPCYHVLSAKTFDPDANGGG